LLDGLEAVELRLSEVLEDNDKFRIDSKYFNKESLYLDKLLKVQNHFYLNNIVSGPFGSTLKSHSYLDKGIAFIRVENLKNRFIIQKDSLVYISDKNNELLKNSQLFLNDLVMSKVGNTIGLIARVDEEIGTCNISENNLGIKLSNFSESEKFYILVYLNSSYAQNLILRRISGNAQPKLNVSDMQKIPILSMSDIFQSKIEKLVKLSHQKLQQSKSLYKKAEELLLKELDLLDYKPSNKNVAIKNLSESFGISGRLDSEYYQPKYDEIIDKIKSYKGGFTSLNDILIFISTGEYSDVYYSKEKKLSFYIRSTNIKNGLVEKDENHFVDKNNFTKFVKEGDIVTARVGTLGIFGTIDKNLHNSIYSDNVLCFRLPNTLNPYVYTLFLNSKYNKLLIDRLARGSVQQRLNQETLKNLFIPIIDHSIQTQIEEKIKESFNLKEKSKQLLEVAKKAVEIAIEQNEDIAMEYINDQI